jgi:hypothetical protein
VSTVFPIAAASGRWSLTLVVYGVVLLRSSRIASPGARNTLYPRPRPRNLTFGPLCPVFSSKLSGSCMICSVADRRDESTGATKFWRKEAKLERRRKRVRENERPAIDTSSAASVALDRPRESRPATYFRAVLEIKGCLIALSGSLCRQANPCRQTKKGSFGRLCLLSRQTDSGVLFFGKNSPGSCGAWALRRESVGSGSFSGTSARSLPLSSSLGFS